MVNFVENMAFISFAAFEKILVIFNPVRLASLSIVEKIELKIRSNAEKILTIECKYGTIKIIRIKEQRL